MTLRGGVYDTVRYFDLSDQAVTPVVVWRALCRYASPGTPVRYRAVCAALDQLVAQRRLGTRHGYYTLTGRTDLIVERQKRLWLAQDKWRRTRSITRMLAAVPFVRGVAMSGSLAVGNTRTASDLDLFVIVRARHIWTARLLMLCVTSVLGVRRKHWDTEAPNKVCLNHYITTAQLEIDTDIQNLYTAQLYRHLVPLYGPSCVAHFIQANEEWLARYVGSPPTPDVSHVYAVRNGLIGHGVKYMIEKILDEPLMRWVETLAETIQRRVIQRHTPSPQPGRVVLSATELAFHPHTKVPALLAQFHHGHGR